MTAINERGNPDIDALLATLRGQDSNGWCVATDGSMDEMLSCDVIAALEDALAGLSFVGHPTEDVNLAALNQQQRGFILRPTKERNEVG